MGDAEGGSGNHYNHMIEDPSSRFPIAPCASHHRDKMSPINRILVYTQVPYDPPEESGNVDSNNYGDDEMQCDKSFGTPLQYSRTPDLGAMSDSAAEDFHSTKGDRSDNEAEQVPSSLRKLSRGPSVRWRRPLIDSAVL